MAMPMVSTLPPWILNDEKKRRRCHHDYEFRWSESGRRFVNTCTKCGAHKI